ncbi:putative glucan endo-1,3-beta-glucosidase A-like [Capsicum annuum]|nr:putative glucan endo-1,3-beta-glucosidase A-like [Capsicum annuum]
MSDRLAQLEMKKPFFSLTLSAFGQVLKEQDKFIKLIGEVILIPANFERQQNLATAHKDDDALGDEDLIDVLLRVKKDRSLEFPITNDNIKGKMTRDSQMQDATTSVGETNIATSSRTNAPPITAPAEYPKKFVGIEFKRWQQKMFFYLTTLCLQRFTSEDAPEVPKGTSDKECFIILEAWKHSNFLCRNYILSGIQDDLYNVYKDNKAAERRSKGNSTINGAHIVKDDQNNSMKRKKAEQGSNQPKKKLKGKCFNCGKIGHKCMDCRAPKKGKIKDQENMIESNKECDDLCAMFSEYNLVRNPHKW